MDSRTQAHVATDVRECSYVRILGYADAFGDEGRLLDAFLSRVHSFGDQLQQLSHRPACVLHEDDRSASFAFAFGEGDFSFDQTAGDEHHSGFRVLQTGQVFLVRDEGEMVRLRLFDRRYIAHLGVGVAIELSA